MTSAPEKGIAARLRVHSRPMGADTELLDLLPAPDGVLTWLRDGEGLVGWGEALRFTPSGPNRFTQADLWWRGVCEHSEVLDEVRLPGTGAVAFVSMAFADHPGDSVLVVPRVLVGRRDGVTWVTEISADGDGAPVNRSVQPVRRTGTVRYSEGELPVTGYRRAVRAAVDRMRAGELGKVVLAHDLVATAEEPFDPRFLLHGLAERYPSCWVYAVEGLLGATPEMLLSKLDDEVTSRVLAGTSWPHGGVSADELAARLLSSPKNREEHAYAVESLVETLRPHCATLRAPASPEVLRLPNVLHLSSDVTGRLRQTTDAPSLLRLAAAVHPTAAVGGTPQKAAVEMIAELERMDRGRYAGPVGWIDARGDGELGIALRCAQVIGTTARLFAGCGLVADSDPDSEVTEAAAKLVPIRDALEGN
ncbi:isochorismate synthase [Allokutzneria oryzae]|uniref:isochorismate synthase n=1 Tax=Allokutzneria oryzae TaxID=1378989 RepID=A0ABV5ZWF6_9PSEU